MNFFFSSKNKIILSSSQLINKLINTYCYKPFRFIKRNKGIITILRSPHVMKPARDQISFGKSISCILNKSNVIKAYFLCIEKNIFNLLSNFKKVVFGSQILINELIPLINFTIDWVLLGLLSLGGLSIYLSKQKRQEPFEAQECCVHCQKKTRVSELKQVKFKKPSEFIPVQDGRAYNVLRHKTRTRDNLWFLRRYSPNYYVLKDLNYNSITYVEITNDLLNKIKANNFTSLSDPLCPSCLKKIRKTILIRSFRIINTGNIFEPTKVVKERFCIEQQKFFDQNVTPYVFESRLVKLLKNQKK